MAWYQGCDGREQRGKPRLATAKAATARPPAASQPNPQNSHAQFKGVPGPTAFVGGEIFSEKVAGNTFCIPRHNNGHQFKVLQQSS